MDQGRTRAQAGAHMDQGHGPGPGPMDRAIISEAANAADFKGGCGGCNGITHMACTNQLFQIYRRTPLTVPKQQH